MSGRSGYRKTDRRRNRNVKPAPKADYVLRFMLPSDLAFAIAPGEHGWGVTVGFHDVVFTHGHHPAHCFQLAADFLDRIGARGRARTIDARVVKLLPCSAHAPTFRREGFQPLGRDLEAVHDNISRNAHNWRSCSIDIGADTITFTGITPKPVVHDFADGGHRRPA